MTNQITFNVHVDMAWFCISIIYTMTYMGDGLGGGIVRSWGMRSGMSSTEVSMECPKNPKVTEMPSLPGYPC